jgi:NAD dependent epimerase/dehydratase
LRVFITGASGFIGSHLVEKLIKTDVNVRGMVHYNSRNDWGLLELLPKNILDEVDVISGDIQDPFFVRRAVKGCDVVFHLSSLIGIPYSYVAPSSYISTNVQGALNIMQACLEEGVKKVVHTSTSEIYGTAQYVPIDENHSLQGQSPYSASKIGADKIAESFFLSFGLPVATIRPFNTYGPRQSVRAIIPVIITQVMNGGPLRIGSLNPTRDLNYVSDTIDGFIKIAESDRSIGEVINIGSGQEISIGDLARKIMKILGKDLEILTDEQRVRPEKSEVKRLLADNRKARELIGWEPKTTLDKGLKKTIAWFTENKGHYKSTIYNL